MKAQNALFFVIYVQREKKFKKKREITCQERADVLK